MKKVYFSISEEMDIKLKQIARTKKKTKKELMLEILMETFGENQKLNLSASNDA